MVKKIFLITGGLDKIEKENYSVVINQQKNVGIYEILVRPYGQSI